MSNEMKRVRAFGSPFRLRFVLSIALGAFAILSSVGLMATSAFLISRAALHRPVMELGLAVVGVRFFALSRVGNRYAERLVAHDAAFRFLGRMRAQVFQKLEPLVPGNIQTMHSGDVLSRFVADTDTLQNIYLRGYAPICVAVLVGIVVFIATWFILPIAAVILLMFLLAAGVVSPVLAARHVRAQSQTQARLRADLARCVVDLSEGHDELLVMGATDVWLQHANEADRALTDVDRKYARTAGISSSVITACALLAMLGMLVVGARALSRGEIKPEQLAVLGFVGLAAFESVMVLPASLIKLNEIRASALRVFELIDRKPLVQDPPFASALPSAPLDLQVLHATLQYPGRDKPVFRDVSFRINAGQRVAIVGASGSGKTSLAHAIAGVRPLREGSIDLNGTELTSLRQEDITRVIGLVDEDSYVFHGTLRDNMRLAKPDVSDDELNAVANRVGLTGWVDELPLGWSTEVGEGGVQLSGGQRRRFVLARMLLADPQVLIVDEPTAGLDGETADLVMDDLLDATNDRTVVVITHRFSDLDRFDAVVRMDVQTQ